MALFRSLGSIHILSLLGLTTVTILDTQSVASLTGARMFSSTILSNSSLSDSLRVTCILAVLSNCVHMMEGVFHQHV